mgnify:CR=1 FL=1
MGRISIKTKCAEFAAIQADQVVSTTTLAISPVSRAKSSSVETTINLRY